MLQVRDWLSVASHGCSNPTSCSCPKTNFPMTMWTTHGSTTWRDFEVQLEVFQSRKAWSADSKAGGSIGSEKIKTCNETWHEKLT